MNRKIVCHNCKSILAPGSTFCPQCGAKISSADYVYDNSVPVNTIYLIPGTVLHMQYRINGVIGQGGFGITYDGTDLKLDMHVAIKEYFPNPMATRKVTVSNEVTCGENTVSLYEQGMNNFLKEAKNMAKYAGEENFVSVHDYFAENNTAYIIMEYVEGQNLKEYLKQHGRLTMDETMAIIMPVMNTLEKIHSRKMIHRDISPSNIMILPDGRVRLLDFGAARDLSLETQNMTTMSAVYKYGYSPIEQQTRDMPQGPYSDIYALCATIYEMLTGSTPPSPFNRLAGSEELIPPSRLGVNILPGQEAALLKGLAIYGNERVQSIAELRDAFCGNGAGYAGAYSGASYRGSGDDTRFVQGSDDPNRPLKFALVGIASFLVILMGGMVIYNAVAGGRKSDTTPVAVVEGSQEENEEETESIESEAAQQTGSGETEEAESETVQSGNAEAVAVTQAEGLNQNTETEETPESEEETEEEPEPAEEEETYNFPDGALSYNGHHYFIYNDVTSSWEDAMDRCIERGGYLAVINDSGENEELFDYMVSRGYDEAYFGLTDPNGDWSWQYIYGDTSSFRDWGTNSKGVAEPNNADGDEIHVHLDIHMENGHWNDARFGKTVYSPEGKKYKDKYAYICEWDQ